MGKSFCMDGGNICKKHKWDCSIAALRDIDAGSNKNIV